MKNFADNTIKTIKNVQVYPAKKRVELNDKATKIIFNLTRESYQALVEKHLQANITEKKNRKKRNVKSAFFIQNEHGYSNFVPLTEFDRAVLSVCVSNWLEGNQYVTPAIIYRGLTGKVDKTSNFTPHSDQYTAIIQSLDKMMFTSFDPDVLHSLEELKYVDADEGFEILKSAILPCYRVKITLNGQVTEAVFFDRESPLLQLASIKKQLITYDSTLLDVPNQNNTPKIITLKNYIMRRVQEIKLHKQLKPIMTFDDIFKKCRIEKKIDKQRSRDYISAFFEHLMEKKIIKSFEFTKKHTAFYSVKFAF